MIGKFTITNDESIFHTESIPAMIQNTIDSVICIMNLARTELLYYENSTVQSFAIDRKERRVLEKTNTRPSKQASMSAVAQELEQVGLYGSM